jgi:hypothetical protein
MAYRQDFYRSKGLLFLISGCCKRVNNCYMSGFGILRAFKEVAIHVYTFFHLYIQTVCTFVFTSVFTYVYTVRFILVLCIRM